MKTSQAGFDLIKRSEGLRLQPYTDVADFLTIGYGHKVVPPATYEHGITEQTADMILAEDVQTAEDAINRLVKVQLTQGQFDALVDFVFNLGSGRLENSTLLILLNAGDYDGAAQQLLRWEYGGGQIMAALKARREAELAMWSGK